MSKRETPLGTNLDRNAQIPITRSLVEGKHIGFVLEGDPAAVPPLADAWGTSWNSTFGASWRAGVASPSGPDTPGVGTVNALFRAIIRALKRT